MSGGSAPAGAVDPQAPPTQGLPGTGEPARKRALAGAAASSPKRPRSESWTARLERQNRYGYRLYSISEDAQIEVASADGAYVPFKVRTAATGETEIHVVVNQRLITSIEEIEDFAKKRAFAHSCEWFGRAIGKEEIDAMFSSPLRRDERYPTKLKCYARPPSIVTYTTADGETSSGQGAESVEELIEAHNGLQGLPMTGQLSAMIWASRRACGVRFYIRTANMSERSRPRAKRDSAEMSRLEDRIQAMCERRGSAS